MKKIILILFLFLSCYLIYNLTEDKQDSYLVIGDLIADNPYLKNNKQINQYNKKGKKRAAQKAVCGAVYAFGMHHNADICHLCMAVTFCGTICGKGENHHHRQRQSGNCPCHLRHN